MGKINLYPFALTIAIGLVVFQGCTNGGRSVKGDGGDATGCYIVASDGARCIQEQPDPDPESESRFKVEIKEIESLEHDEANKLVYAQLQLRMIPTVQSDKKAATVFLGLLNLHDPKKISDGKDTKSLTCQESPSCIDSKALLREDHPTILVGGHGSTGVPVYWSFKYPDTLKRLRLKWEFYQKEHDGALHCDPVKDKAYPSDGIPFVHAVNSEGEQIARWCYGDIEVFDFRAPHLRG